MPLCVSLEEHARGKRPHQFIRRVVWQQVLNQDMWKWIEQERSAGDGGCGMGGEAIASVERRAQRWHPVGVPCIGLIRRDALLDLGVQRGNGREDVFLALQRLVELFELARDRPQLPRHLFLIFSQFVPEILQPRNGVRGAYDSERIETFQYGHSLYQHQAMQGQWCSPYGRRTGSLRLRRMM